jgi:hypothetical protein
MADKGALTTYTSNIALIVSGIYAARTVTPEALYQIIIIIAVFGIAALDIKYPRLREQLEAALSGNVQPTQTNEEPPEA